MVFDCHHHVIKENLSDYNHPSVTKFTKLAATTWPRPEWQLVHISNGDSAFLDRYHSPHITMMPRAYKTVPWIEIEARAKEQAIAALSACWPTQSAPQ
jgi:UV DNA damage endonuclease